MAVSIHPLGDDPPAVPVAPAQHQVAQAGQLAGGDVHPGVGVGVGPEAGPHPLQVPGHLLHPDGAPEALLHEVPQLHPGQPGEGHPQVGEGGVGVVPALPWGRGERAGPALLAPAPRPAGLEAQGGFEGTVSGAGGDRRDALRGAGDAGGHAQQVAQGDPGLAGVGQGVPLREVLVDPRLQAEVGALAEEDAVGAAGDGLGGRPDVVAGGGQGAGLVPLRHQPAVADHHERAGGAGLEGVVLGGERQAPGVHPADLAHLLRRAQGAPAALRLGGGEVGLSHLCPPVGGARPGDSRIWGGSGWSARGSA